MQGRECSVNLGVVDAVAVVVQPSGLVCGHGIAGPLVRLVEIQALQDGTKKGVRKTHATACDKVGEFVSGGRGNHRSMPATSQFVDEAAGVAEVHYNGHMEAGLCGLQGI